MRHIMRWRDSAWAFWFWSLLIVAFPATMTVEALFSWSDPLTRFGLAVIWAIFFLLWVLGGIPIAIAWAMARRRDRGRS